MGIYRTLKHLTKEEPITLLTFLAGLKDKFHNYGVCKGMNVLVLVYVLSYGDKNV